MRKKLVLFLAILTSMLTLAAVSVNASSSAGSSASFLESKGLLQGDNGNLMLDKPLTREQMMVIISRLLGTELSAKSYKVDTLSFADVPKESWAAPYIAWARSKKITEGYSEKRFGYGESLTKWQTEAFLVRALGYNVKDDQIEKKAADLGLLDGIYDNNGESSQTKIITRGRMAQLVYNSLFAKSSNDEMLGEKIGALKGTVQPIDLDGEKDNERVVFYEQDLLDGPLAMVQKLDSKTKKWATQFTGTYSSAVEGYWGVVDKKALVLSIKMGSAGVLDCAVLANEGSKIKKLAGDNAVASGGIWFEGKDLVLGDDNRYFTWKKTEQDFEKIPYDISKDGSVSIKYSIEVDGVKVNLEKADYTVKVGQTVQLERTDESEDFDKIFISGGSNVEFIKDSPRFKIIKPGTVSVSIYPYGNWETGKEVKITATE